MIRQKTSRNPATIHHSPRGLRRVLVALDGSPESETILDHVKKVVPPRSLLILLHVVPAPALSSDRDLQGVLHIEEDAERYLEKMQARLSPFRTRWIVET